MLLCIDYRNFCVYFLCRVGEISVAIAKIPSRRKGTSRCLTVSLLPFRTFRRHRRRNRRHCYTCRRFSGVESERRPVGGAVGEKDAERLLTGPRNSRNDRNNFITAGARRSVAAGPGAESLVSLVYWQSALETISMAAAQRLVDSARY
ncbi:hypothetical protein GWI33_023172 [Rhynchophorus ferrugineus]|uniref:Uncharacterized protein n=1 Tax=Rhynchophorus ferrugineus TaxID=354439 RepID=A0A834HZS4_RHYFE|nr:hypothetical protein GWI33_023172 [Rhynchophorus ferrugineus]